MKKWVRAGVFVVFFGWLCSSLAVVNKIEIGLDQVQDFIMSQVPLYLYAVCCKNAGKPY
jgi:hypothetical protein